MDNKNHTHESNVNTPLTREGLGNGAIFTLPNLLTCCNLICGCMATGAAFYGNYRWAIVMIICGLLGISSPIGKELDSLADVVTFGVAPSAIIFYLFHEVHYPDMLASLSGFIPYTAFLMAGFSALRLAKFNLDTRQTTSFIGLPTPANALFWGSLVVGQHAFLVSPKFNAVFLFLFMFLSCLLLVAEIPLFSLKFKDLSWQHNKVKYIFLLGCIACLPLGTSALAAIIVWYVALSLAAKQLKFGN